MALYESGEMYLETIYMLSQTNPNIRAIDVGESMGYSKPSVSRAISVLKADGYVYIDQAGYIRLTEDGAKIGKKIFNRHLLFSEFLKKIGVPEDIAIQDACKMEHAVSDETYEALKLCMKLGKAPTSKD